MSSSEHINELAAALAAAQGEMGHAAKDTTNPHFGKKYADLASVVDACREPLSKHGIAVLQSPRVDSDKGVVVTVETKLVHKSGQWASTEIASVVPDAKPQTLGSAITYLRRYGLAAMTGIAPDDDDDGNASSGRTDKPQTQGGQGGGQQRERRTPPPTDKPKKTPAERVQDGVKKLEDLATKLGGEWPANLATEFDQLGMVVVEPEKAEIESVKNAFTRIVELVKRYQEALTAKTEGQAA